MRIREGLVSLLQVHDGNSLGLEAGIEINLSSEQEEKFANYLKELVVTRADMSGSEIEDAALYFVLTHINTVGATPIPLPLSLSNDDGMGGVRADFQRVREGLDRVGGIVDRVGGGVEKVRGAIEGIDRRVDGGVSAIEELVKKGKPWVEGWLNEIRGDLAAYFRITAANEMYDKEEVEEVKVIAGEVRKATEGVRLVGKDVTDALNTYSTGIVEGIVGIEGSLSKEIREVGFRVESVESTIKDGLKGGFGEVVRQIMILGAVVAESVSRLGPLDRLKEIEGVLKKILEKKEPVKKWYEGGLVRNTLLAGILILLGAMLVKGQNTSNSVLMQGYNGGVLIPSATRLVGPFRINCDGTTVTCTWASATSILTIAGVGPSGGAVGGASSLTHVGVIPKITGVGVLGESSITETGGNIGIGAASVTYAIVNVAVSSPGDGGSLYGMQLTSTLNASLTSTYTGLRILPRVAAGAITIPYYYGLYLNPQGGAGSVIGNYYSIYSASGSLGVPTNAWGLYMDDALPNYFGGKVGIGTVSALTQLTVADTSVTSLRGILSIQFSSSTDGARVGFAKARGTVAVPTIVLTGDMLGRVMFRGFDGANYLEMGGIDVGVSGTVAATRVPTYMTFSTATDALPSVLTERMRILNNGNVGIGTTSPSALLTIEKDAIGATATDGLVLQNTTLAAAGAQQSSPRIRLTGQGWKVAATAASQQVDWTIENLPIQGGSYPTPYLSFFVNVADGVGSQRAVSFSWVNSSSGYGSIFLGNNVINLANISGNSANTNINANNGGAIVLNAGTSGGAWESYIAFKIATIESVRITTNGNVGIGTTTPTYSLDVSKGVGLTGTARFYDRTVTTGVTLVTITPGAAQTAASVTLVNGGSMTNTGTLAVTSTFAWGGGQVGYAACKTAAGLLGYCSDIVSVTGTCTCN